MINIGLKTAFWNKYKSSALKVINGIGGYSSDINSMRGLAHIPQNDILTSDDILSEMYYMAYMAVDGKKNKLGNTKLFKIHNISLLLWVYFMSIRFSAKAFEDFKKEGCLSPYLLNDLNRIITSKGINCYIKDNGNGTAFFELGFNGYVVSATVRYRKFTDLATFLTSTLYSFVERELYRVLAPSELNYIKKEFIDCGVKVSTNFYM